MVKSFKKICIANRGEIALRIGRACKKKGIATFQPVSEADKDSSFVQAADDSAVIGKAAAADSYLNIEKIVQAALNAGCDAVHPGYGFLSENSDFAKAVSAAGLTFIGPSAEVIRLLGNKTEARKAVTARGVSVAPGVSGGLSDDQIRLEVEKIDFPIILKAVAGGGGRGMRVVRNTAELLEALPRVRAEAKKFFASEDVYFERYIENPRHVEVQLFGDTHGNIVHFGTRECSLQRRHQKIVEEAPAVFLSDELRKRIESDAVNAAASVGYVNAGTAEFLVSGDTHYFLEINTRIQVEHPVTELVAGVDLVSLQLDIAAGGKLPGQESISLSGHAIECRIYAEDAANNFMPTKGQIKEISTPELDFLREDRGFEAGDVVSLHYDALLTKLIVHGKNREEALARMRRVLQLYSVDGLETSLSFHKWLFMQSAFVADRCDIAFLDNCFEPDSLAAVESIWQEALKSQA